MVESSGANSESLPFPGLRTRLGTAVFLSFYDNKDTAFSLMKRLSKRTARYAIENESHLDQFLVKMSRITFHDYMGNDPSKYSDKNLCGQEAFPSLETKFVAPDLEIRSILFDKMLSTFVLAMSDDTCSPRLGVYEEEN